MSRDQRVHDNWALLYAAEQAAQHHTTLTVVFCLVTQFQNASFRQFDFMLTGLAEVEKELQNRGIGFILLEGSAPLVLPRWLHKQQAGGVVTDFSPLRIGREWREQLGQSISIPLIEVDAHNIIPAWITSPKQEYAARTIRPKINRLLPQFLTDFPPLPHTFTTESTPSINWEKLRAKLKGQAAMPPITWIKPGEKAAHQALTAFIRNCLTAYEVDRNDPTKSRQSDVSPYLHFGQISAQRIALAVKKAVHDGQASRSSADAFLEELIVRRELADNFCLYQPAYDQVTGFPQWAQASLAKHATDQREHLYTLDQLEQAQTSDALWNAAQQQMITTGKMHGYMRMYWAKKILEWSKDAAIAQQQAIYLNDKYELDGRDPNGYTGIAWSIGGVHDRPWFDRPIFGMVRYMNRSGADKKFDTKKYIEQWS